MSNVEVEVYIGLGSNLAEPVAQLAQARQAVAQLPHVRELAFSHLYRSPPMGPQDQPDYVNAAMRIATTLPALDLLHQLQAIENQQGRVRERRWGARTLDLDLLLYGDRRIDLPDLIVPHPGIAERAFVLYPLADIAPADLSIPGFGTLTDCLSACPLAGLTRLS
jgi:2-amino-4-hydroxy-6-hydroxymethyldihydropteridine diphosphokinase